MPLSDADYKLMKKILDKQPYSVEKLLDDEHKRADSLIARNLLEVERRNLRPYENNSYDTVIMLGFESDDYLSVSVPDGLDALEAKEKEIKQQAKDEVQRRFQNQISIANVLVPLITFVLGLVVEHFAGIIRAIAALVK